VINLRLSGKTLAEMAKLYELHVSREKLKLFEKKYTRSFEDFEREVLEKEDFEKWDDYLEWKAYIKALETLRGTE
jgi:hypothetical protein